MLDLSTDEIFHTTTIRAPPSITNSRTSMGRNLYRLHYPFTKLQWEESYLGWRRPVIQILTFYLLTIHLHSCLTRNTLPPPHLPTTWATKNHPIQSGSIVSQPLLESDIQATRGQTTPLECLPPSNRRANRSGKSLFGVLPPLFRKRRTTPLE